MTQQCWFAIKTLYRTTAKGHPRNRDGFYQSGVAAIEERIVLFTARNNASAIKKGESEARRYAKSVCTTNKYGQQVITEFIGLVESYEMFDPPGNGIEIHSRMQSVPARTAVRTLIANRRGDPIDPSLSPQFISGDISVQLESVFGSKWPNK